jgi:predicted esterase
MPMAHDAEYAATVATIDREVAEFIRAFEAIQENLRFGAVADSQAALVAAVGGTFRTIEREFIPTVPPPDQAEFHTRFAAALTELGKACNLFMTAPSRDWTVAFLYSRRAFCTGLYALYELRADLPQIATNFTVPGGNVPIAPEGAATGGVSTGFIQRKRDENRSDYTLYIPEDYSPDKPLGLIVALHGGYGQGSEYIWTWLRPARSRGYAILSPKSLGETWEMETRSRDSRSVTTMLDEIKSEYAIDPARVYLSGLSDGGIFTYILGLAHHELFRGIAPVAGALHLAVDPILREGRGKDTPIFVVHGVHDYIFPVTFTRQTCQLLTQLGYQVKYEELPDWGHALPYSINERLVAPWFDGLPAKQASCQ